MILLSVLIGSVFLLVDRQSWLFTGILPKGYSPPASFCFDIECSDPPIMVRYYRLLTFYYFYELNVLG
jgi:hypothetical protein